MSLFCFRMDLVITQGESLKNREAFILLPPDAQHAMSVLISSREMCGVPKNNSYVFARMNATSPLSGTEDLRELKRLCPDLKYPDRITFTTMRKYAATVTQVIVLQYPWLSIVWHICCLSSVYIIGVGQSSTSWYWSETKIKSSPFTDK